MRPRKCSRTNGCENRVKTSEREREKVRKAKKKATMLPQALLNNSKAQFKGHQKIRDGIPQAQISERCCRMCKLSCNMMIMMCSELLTNVSTSTCPHSVDLLRVPPNSFLFGVSTADGSLAMTQAAWRAVDSTSANGSISSELYYHVLAT